MDKKISSTFGILVALIIAGYFGSVFLIGNREQKTKKVYNAQFIEENSLMDDKEVNRDEALEKESENQEKTNIKELQEIIYNKNGSINPSNWKVYRNEKYGFEFKFPSDWDIEDGLDDDLGGVYIRDGIKFAENSDWTTYFYVQVKFIGGYGMEGYDMKVEDVILGGLNAKKNTFVGFEDHSKSEFSAEMEDDDFYDKYMGIGIDFPSLDNEYFGVGYSGDKNKEIFFNAFLESFKFIK